VNEAGADHRIQGVTALLIGALLAALFHPTLRWLAGEWLGNNYYSHGILVPIVSAFLAWRLWTKRSPEVRRFEGSGAGLLPLALGLGIYLVALHARAYFVASLAMVLSCSGLVWFLLGAAVLRRFWFPIVFLLFAIPLPFVEPLSAPLAQLTGACAADVVSLFGLPIAVAGAQVSLPNVSLVVEAQCSGLRSIVTLLTLVALVVFVVRGRRTTRMLLALSSLPIAVAANIMRVASLLVVAETWGIDAAFTYYHDYSALLFFLSALGLLLLFSRVLGCREIREELF
jgi:exosortase